MLNVVILMSSPFFSPSRVDVLKVLAVSATIVAVSAGLSFWFRKRNSMSKTLSATWILVLLALALSEAGLTVLDSENSNALSLTELRTNLPGKAGYSIFQPADGCFIYKHCQRLSDLSCET